MNATIMRVGSVTCMLVAVWLLGGCSSTGASSQRSAGVMRQSADGGAGQASPAMILRGQKLRAQALRVEGEAALRAGRPAEAVRLLEQSLLLDPTVAEVRGMLAEAVAQRDAADDTPSLLDDYLLQHRVRRQAALAEYEQWMHTAREAMDRGDFKRASQAITMAELSLERNRRWLDQDTHTQLSGSFVVP